MPTLGAQSFISLNGEVDQLGERVQDITRPGLDGHGYRLGGKRASVFNIVAVVDIDDDGVDSVQDQMAVYKAMQGTKQTFTDSFGSAYANIVILDSRLLRSAAVQGAVGGISTEKAFLMEVLFVCRASDIPA